MKEKKSSQESLKQSKITAFWLKGPGDRKRKNEEACQSLQPTPKSMKFNCQSPDLFQTSSKKETSDDGCQKENEWEDFAFEDLENDPFSSPKKEKSPKKKVLAENFTLKSGDGNWEEVKSDLNFETPVKCKVVKSTFFTKGRFELVLVVEEEKSEKKGVCKLRDVWTSSSFSPGDVVSILAVLSEDGWVVDNKLGLVVLYPDLIISSTSLVSSMFCLRQGILMNFYKGVDSGGYDKMLIGRVVHELLQECLKIRPCTDDDISRIADSFTRSTGYLRDFYFSGLTVSAILKELEGFVPRVKNFLDVYVNKKSRSVSAKNFEGTIEEVLDIEELIRSPCLGVQGRVDVTVKVRSRNSEEKVAPLELKTGKASFSNEHKSQLTLYVMLMKELGRRVESGLLLYLREDIMEEITPQRDEIRNLFLLRNQFVRFYKSLRNYELPDPIKNARACARCSYLRVCTTYARGQDSECLSDSHPLRTFDFTDIRPNHVDYFVEWNKMLWLEHDSAGDEVEISGLKLEPEVEESSGEFKHSFRKIYDHESKIVRPGAFVHVVNEKNHQVCTGRIADVTNSVLSVTMDKKLEDYSESYKITVHQSKFLMFYLTNLGLFLEEQFESLREIIISKKLPSFEKKLDKKEFKDKCLKILMDLNKEQQAAVLKALLTEDYLLIKGPPGTGKTQTIVALVRILAALGKKVLVASHTHSSVDNILLRLSDVEFLRLGAPKSVHKDIRASCYANLAENCSSIDDVGKLFGRQVIASTCLGIDTDFVRKEKLDVCIVDESSQVLQPEILRPLFCCKKFILVGDEDQLAPVVQSVEAKKLGMDRSIFEWLRHESATVSLKRQFRMNSVINALANSVAYNGLIECGNGEVAKATLAVTQPETFLVLDDWTRNVLSTELEKSVFFVDTSAYFEKEGVKLPEGSRSSLLEANIIIWLIECLIKLGLEEKHVGVIASFCDQIALLKKRFREKELTEVEINTVDQYQGRDKGVILFSCTKQNLKGKEVVESELLNDKRRLTVAVTRAKHKLIVVGDRQTVVRYEPFQKLLKSLSESQVVGLPKTFPWGDSLDPEIVSGDYETTNSENI